MHVLRLLRKFQTKVRNTRPHWDAGSMTAFGLTMTVGVVGLSVVVIDQMNYEAKRVVAQDALDRCVLMTALAQNSINGGVPTSFTATQVANDCLAKSGAEDVSNVNPIIINQNSEVDVTLTNEFQFSSTGFMDTPLGDSLDYDMAANYYQKIPNIEITIAIDLNDIEFLSDFKDQLKKFIRTVTAPDTGGKISFNIMPFAGDVNLSTDIINRFNTVNRTEFSMGGQRSCLVLPDASKSVIALNMGSGTTYSWSWPVHFMGNYSQQTSWGTSALRPYFEFSPTPFYAGAELHNLQIANLQEPSYFTSPNTTPWGVCRYMTTANNPVLGVQPDRSSGKPNYDAINARIDGLVANKYDIFAQSNNAIALKWALAFMDPSTQRLFNPMPNNGMSSSKVVGRPLAYDAPESYKILIFASNSLFFMSDGSLSTAQSGTDKRFASMVREIRPEFLDGSEPAPEIYRTPSSSVATRNVRFSIRHDAGPGKNKFWVTESGDPADTKGFIGFWAEQPFSYPGEGPAQRLSWKQVFESMSVDFLIERLHLFPLEKINALGTTRYSTLADRFTFIATKRSLLLQNFKRLCTEARQKGVIVYTILGDGLMNKPTASVPATIHTANAPTAQAALRDCATTPIQSFNGSVNASLKTAMLTIASSINQMAIREDTN